MSGCLCPGGICPKPDTDNEAEMDVESITDGSYNNCEKPTNTRAISTFISALIEDKLKQQIWKD
jgi:hypothetical protein